MVHSTNLNDVLDPSSRRRKLKFDFLSGKRLKVSASDSGTSSSPACLSFSCDSEGQMPSSSSLEKSCQMNGNSDAASHASGAAGRSYPSENDNGHGLSDFVTGWMYLNEQGQMCGPYIQQQLFEGLSTGFLPDELPVYPISNGALLNPVQLKLFKQYPDHVATGFTHLGRSSAVSMATTCHVVPGQDTPTDSGSVLLNNDQQSYVQQTCNSSNVTVSDSKSALGTTVVQQQSLSWEERCWLYLDSYGRGTGPHSLSELYSWHQYGYLHNSVMIYHIDNKFSHFTLLSLVNAWRKGSSTVTASETKTIDSMELISGISEEIGSQLHNGIIKAARRLVLDEIIGNVIVDYVATKKAQKQYKNKHGIEDLRICPVNSQRNKTSARDRNSSVSYVETSSCHDNASTSANLAKEILEEPLSGQCMKSIGSFENFQEVNKAVSRVIFDYCLEVLWNAVSYDPVAHYVLSWRKNKRWSNSSSEGASALDKMSNANSQNTAEANGELGTLVNDLDCPPGFHSIVQDSLFCDSSLISRSHFQEDKLANPSSQDQDEDRQRTIARVEEELFMFAKVSMVDFLKTTVEKEAFKIIKCFKYDRTNEVPVENSGQLCKDSDSGHALMMDQGLDYGDISFDEFQIISLGTGLIHQPAGFLNSHSSSDFLGIGFRSLGTPSSTAIDDSAADESLPLGITDLTVESSAQHLQKLLLDHLKIPIEALRSSQSADPAREYDSSSFIGSAFKRMGMPICRGIDDHRTNEPPLPGSGSKIKDMVSSSISKFRPLGLGEGIPKLKKFMVLALCRQKLHDYVLREWISSLFDNMLLKQRDIQEEMPKSSPPVQPELDLLMERSISCHSSGPSQVSVVEEFTYSRRKKMQKNSGAEPNSPPLRDFKLHQPRNSKNVSGSGALSIKRVCLRETESSTLTSKLGAVPKNVVKDRQSIRSSNGRKLKSIVALDHPKYGGEWLSGMEAASNDNQELSRNSICGIEKKDKLALDHSQRLKNSSVTSNLKRKNLDDESPSLPSKAAKLLDTSAKQAVSKIAGRKTKLSKSRVLSSCPVSVGCARSSIDGWEWRKWSLHARPGERARVRGIQITNMQRFTSDSSGSHPTRVKGISARTNRVKMRNLLAAVEGTEILKASQLKARKKRLRFQRSKIHDWGLVALEPIEAEDFVIEYVGELIRPRISDIRECQYEKMGIGSSYLFRLDDGHVVDATKRGGIARFINHSCEPNCYTKIVSVESQKRIFIYAKRHISAGEEITYNYKFPLEEKKIPCNCGAKRCRGSMN